QTYSQMIMNGRLEMALIHGTGPIKVVRFEPILSEEFFLVAHRDFAIEADAKPVPVNTLCGIPLLLPPAYNFDFRHDLQIGAGAREGGIDRAANE
ncbi:LysR substrate-binding domain-containing protein, partial [Rhizobium leguminosarum]|uniref:LysR substrate-binding domain-containing protein n=1 Tax=Rhizobium leguminosarum TaxID=384 RepID=UPI003F9C967A